VVTVKEAVMVQQWKPCSVALLTAIAAIVVLSAPALAQRTGPPGPIELNLGTTLATPPLFGSFLTCQVVNVGATDILVSVRIFDNTGAQISTFGNGSNPFECTAFQQLEPGRACSVGSSDFALVYCKITAVGNKDALRGALTDGNQNAVEAR
jgi:hypothetical protein